MESARLCRRREVPGDVRALDQGPERLLGRAGQAHPLVQDADQDQEHLVRARQRLDQMVRGRRHQRRPTTASTGICRKRANQTAIIWEGDDPKDDKKITYQELHDEVCRMANILRNRNVEKGDRVTIYMPMIPEAAYAMLACARIGAIHSVVFGGFSPELARRPHRGLQVERRHHRRRRPARRPQGAAQGQHRRRDRQGRRRRSRDRGAAHRRARSTWIRCATSTTTRPPRS